MGKGLMERRLLVLVLMILMIITTPVFGETEDTETSAVEKNIKSAKVAIEGSDGEKTANTSAIFVSSKSTLEPEELAFNGVYLERHCDNDYVTEVDPYSCFQPVTYARSNAAYTYENLNGELTEGKNASNVIAGVSFYTLVYDVSEESDYYVALPDVNMGISGYKPYDVEVIYNNDNGECLDGCHFDRKTSILYIPKGYIDDPQPDNALFDENAPVAIQISYKMPFKELKGGGECYEKHLPVVSFTSTEESPVYQFRDVAVNNIFDITTLIPSLVKDPSAYTKEDFMISLNGTSALLSDEMYEYDPETGSLLLNASAAVLSEVTVMVRDSAASKLKNKVGRLTSDLYAYGADHLTYEQLLAIDALKNTNNKLVYITSSNGDLTKIYTGYRGSYDYNTDPVNGKHSVFYRNTTAAARSKGGSFYTNSEKYLYAASSKSAGWAIISYAIAGNAVRYHGVTGQRKIGKNTTIEVPQKDSNGDDLYKYGGKEGAKTMYEWMLVYRYYIMKFKNSNTDGNGHTSGWADGEGQVQTFNDQGQRNGALTFGFNFPKYLKFEPNMRSTDETDPSLPNFYITTDQLNLNNDNWLAGWCRHYGDDAATWTDSNTVNANTRVFLACLAKGTDNNGQFLVLAFTTGNAIGSNRQNGGAIYKIYVSGGIAVKKTVSGTGADTGKLFTFTMTLKNPSGSNVSGTYSGLTFTSGKAAFQLKHGQTRTIEGIPAGYTYSIQETSDPNYTCNPANGIRSGTINGTVQTVNFTNTHKTADLSIDKTIQSSVPDGDTAFPFLVHIEKTGSGGSAPLTGTYVLAVENGGEGDGTSITFDADGNAQLSLKHGQTAVIRGLPVEYSYSVTEQAVPDYKTESSGSTGSLAPGENHVTFINIPVMKVKVVKKVTGNLGDNNRAFEFNGIFHNLKGGETYPVTGEFPEAETVKSMTADADGNASIEFNLSADDWIQFESLPEGAAYQFLEGESNHTASYNIKSSNEKTGEQGPVISLNEKVNRTAGELSTEEEIVDSTDGTITIEYTNHRELMPATLVEETPAGIMAASIAVLILAILFLIRRKRGLSGE